VDGFAARLATHHVDSLISLADGHVTLSRHLATGGVSPPLDPAHSLTRIGVGANTQRTIAATVRERGASCCKLLQAEGSTCSTR